MNKLWILGFLSLIMMVTGLAFLFEWYSADDNSETLFHLWQPIVFIVGVLALNIFHLRGQKLSMENFKPEVRIKAILGIFSTAIGISWWLIKETEIVGYNQWGIFLLIAGVALLIFSYLDYRTIKR